MRTRRLEEKVGADLSDQRLACFVHFPESQSDFSLAAFPDDVGLGVEFLAFPLDLQFADFMDLDRLGACQAAAHDAEIGHLDTERGAPRRLGHLTREFGDIAGDFSALTHGIESLVLPGLEGKQVRRLTRR